MKKSSHELISSDLIHKGYVDLKIDHVKKGSHKGSFTYISPPSDAVCILAMTQDQKWVVLEEYRHPIGRYVLGLPGGAMEAGEDLLTTAERELLEETGYKASELVHLGSLPPLPALCSQIIHFVLAKGSYLVSTPLLEPFESIETFLLTKDQIEERIRQGTGVDGIFCSGWLLQKLFLEKTV